MSRLAPLIDEFARRHGMAPPAADAEGRYHVVVDDVEVACFERTGQVCLVSRFESGSEGAEGAAWLRQLLNEGLRRMKRYRATPALLEDGTAVLFARWPGADLAVGGLETAIEEHVNAFEGYRSALAGRRTGTRADLPAGLVRGLPRP